MVYPKIVARLRVHQQINKGGTTASERTRVDAKKLINFSTKALQRLGVSEEDAQITARILVAADLRGVESHGIVSLVPFYVRGIQGGRQ